MRRRIAEVVLAMGLAVSAGDTSAQHAGVECWVTTKDMQQRLTKQESITPRDVDDASGTTIRIDTSKTYQTILGLGSSFEHTTCANLWRLDPATRADVVERLVSPEVGIGMNLMRICIGTPDFTGEPWYSYDEMPPGRKDPRLEHFSIEKDREYIIPVLKLALEKNPDLKFFASPWSPPGWMKTCDDMIGGHLIPKYYEVYAQYFVKFVRAYEAEGIPIRAVTVQNEPGVNKRDDTISWWYPSCQWSLVEDEDTWWPVNKDAMGHAERDFIREHLGPAFRAESLSTRIWCYDHNLNNLWYPRAILSDSGAAQFVEGAAFHPYAGKAGDMQEFHAEFPEKSVFLTEGSAFGIQGATRIVDYLRNWASSYNAWVTMIDTEGEPNNGPFKASRTCVTLDAKSLRVDYGFEYYMYGQFMKFIQRGAVRVDSGEQGKEDLAQVAFSNPDGSVVLVAVNTGPESRVLGVSCGATSFEADLPGESVATFRWLG